MDEESTPRKRPRQDPVSCQSCRKRKLKCDRQAPCSGCTTRRIECIYLNGNYYNVNPDTTVARPTPAGAHGEQIPDNAGHTTLLHPAEAGGNDQATQDDPKNEPLKTMDWLETIVMGHWTPSAVPAPMRADLDPHRRSDNLLSNESTIPSYRFNMVVRDQSTLGQSPMGVDLKSYLPPRTESLALFRYYCDNLDYHFRAIIPRQVEQQIQEVYDNRAYQKPINLNHVALLFSIVASALHFRPPTNQASSTTAYSQAAVFLSGAALIQSNYAAYPTIEGLQATMIIGQNLSSTGMPPTVSSLFVPRFAINQAVIMNLHLVESPRLASQRSSDGASEACKELKRRIWWSLVSNDWLLAYLSGPQEWTYSVNPNHMNVQLPQNIEDTDMEHVGEEQPSSTPTAMSYSLCRIQLAVVSRKIVDETASELFEGKEIPYDKILELYRMLQDDLDALPDFYRFGHAHQIRYATLYREQPAFAWQRSLLQLGYHHRICRLHRQYFVRGAKDPKYSCSHIVCLRSARTIIEIKRVMDEDEPIMEPSSSMIWAVVHHVFMAAVILLVDVCFNWEDVLAEKKKEEVIAACRMLTRAQRTSPVAKRAVDAMMEILRKYWIHERGLKCPQAAASQVAAPLRPNDVGAGLHTPADTDYAVTDPSLLQSASAEAPLEDMWTEMLDGSAYVGLDTPDWTQLLNDLTNADYLGE